jgi:hypothetical protein
MLDQLRIHYQIIYDLTMSDLEPLNGCFERLAYLAALRDVTTGEYSHQPLCAAYNPGRVHEVLSKCQADLLKFLDRLAADMKGKVQYCLEHAESWIPPQAPDYLRELFRSNLAVLAELLLKQ